MMFSVISLSMLVIDRHIKEELHQKYKNYRNIIATLMKKSKQNYFTECFESNIKNLKNTWKGIKSIISLKHSASSSLNLLNFNNKLLNDQLKVIAVQLEKKTNQKYGSQVKIAQTNLMVEIQIIFYYTYRQWRSCFHYILTKW